ncbi:hypothetical protein LP417_34380 (plasmid) [Polaromonas sp. P1-6]|nr:hypothetical protein LP417_34380 [Polaromonas sp. P1-6]
MSMPARRALFGSSGFPGLEDKINQMGRMAAIRREGSRTFAKPSGTARQGALITQGVTLGAALATGNVGALMGVLAIAGGANLVARDVTRLGLVNWVAEKSSLSPAAGPATVAATARVPSGDQSDGKKPLNRIQAGVQARKTGGTVEKVEGGFVVRPAAPAPVQPQAPTSQED